MKLIFLTVFIFFFYDIKAQRIYYSSIEDLAIDSLLKTEIGEFNLLTCEAVPYYIDTTIYSVSAGGGIGYYEWVDIALCPDGRLFGLGQDGVYEIDIQNQSEIKLIEPQSPPFRFWSKGLYCSKDSVLYFGERDIGSYDLNSGLTAYYGRLPTATALFSNLFWYDNRLMGGGNTRIIEINLNEMCIRDSVLFIRSIRL